jgi:hypothetical protein
MNWLAASGYEHLSASKSKPLANTSGEPSYSCTTSTYIGMLLSSISGSLEQTPYLLKPLTETMRLLARLSFHA